MVLIFHFMFLNVLEIYFNFLTAAILCQNNAHEWYNIELINLVLNEALQHPYIFNYKIR